MENEMKKNQNEKYESIIRIRNTVVFYNFSQKKLNGKLNGKSIIKSIEPNNNNDKKTFQITLLYFLVF